jgi:peptidoglycan/LPS O-acetylase OafA/YrhL
MNPNSTYRPDIDGLRAVAVLAVVLHHLSASLVPGGYVGVDVFFVISGYLITRIISREMEEGTFTFARFYERRARRIFPALFAMLAVTLVGGYFLLLPSDYSATLRGALGTLFFSSNIVFWRDMAAGYFAATDAGLNPLLHTWSLAVEEQFYVFFPFLLLLCFRFFLRHIVLILIGCAVVSLAGAALLVQSKSVAVFFLSPFRAWELLAGSLLAFNAVPVVRSRALREAIAGAGLLVIVAVCFLYDSKTTFPGLAALAPVLGAAAIMHAGTSGLTLVGRLLQWRPVVYIGLISYSLYLWHWPLIVLVRYAMGMESITPYIPVLLAASLALGSLSYHFIEQPFRRGIRVTREFVFSSSAVFASVLALASVVGLMRGGFETRFSPAVVKLDQARSPQVPFVNCDGKPVGASCTLGSSDGKATTLLWGDSHMLAWGPAFDKRLTEQGQRAVFSPTYSCPPMWGVDNAVKAICPVQNLAVKNYLLANPEIKTVVMSAYWSTYFRKGGPLTAQAGNPPAKGIDAAKNALTSTIQWLRDNGRQVVLIGPVPVYEKSVPLALALEKATDRTLLHSTMDEQRKKHASFFEVVNGASRGGGASFRFLDPIQWVCAEECMVMKDGVPLYRDSHHLSVAGAMSMEDKLSQGLKTAPVERREIFPLAENMSQIDILPAPNGSYTLSK